MNYLEQLALLEFMLNKLYYQTRDQVSVTAIPSITTVTGKIFKTYENTDDPELKRHVVSLGYAIDALTNVKFGDCITDTCKSALVEATVKLRGTIRMKAFDFYKTNDFEPTEEVIPIMRGVVEEALSRKAI